MLDVTEIWLCKISFFSWDVYLKPATKSCYTTKTPSIAKPTGILDRSYWIYSDFLQKLEMYQASVFKVASGINAKLCHKWLKVRDSGLPPTEIQIFVRLITIYAVVSIFILCLFIPSCHFRIIYIFLKNQTYQESYIILCVTSQFDRENMTWEGKSLRSEM